MQIHINRKGQKYGPYTVEQVQNHLAAGKLLPNDLAWHKGLPSHIPLSQCLASLAGNPAAPTASATSASRKGNNGMCIAGLVLGIISVLFSCCCGIFGLPFPVIGIILSSIGLIQTKKDPSQEGRNLGMVGLVLSILAILLSIVGVIFGIGAAIFDK